MTPAFRPFLEHAIADLPEQWALNTYASCSAILQRALAYAGPDWAWIAKVDGESGYPPPGFVPFEMDVTRPDGQVERIRVTRLGHDAAWHRPSLRQVKIILNSAANSDDRESIHGPAQRGGLGSESPNNNIIDPAVYRYTNPPVPQSKVTGTPEPMPTPPSVPPFPPRDVVVGFVVGPLSDFYHAKGRPVAFTTRFHDQDRLVYVDFEGIVVWMSEYLRRMQLGESGTDATAHVLADVAAAWQ